MDADNCAMYPIAVLAALLQVAGQYHPLASEDWRLHARFQQQARQGRMSMEQTVDGQRVVVLHGATSHSHYSDVRVDLEQLADMRDNVLELGLDRRSSPRRAL